MLDINKSRSYANEGLLREALVKRGLRDMRPLVVRNFEGRWTAVFGADLIPDRTAVRSIAEQGFMVID